MPCSRARTGTLVRTGTRLKKKLNFFSGSPAHVHLHDGQLITGWQDHPIQRFNQPVNHKSRSLASRHPGSADHRIGGYGEGRINFLPEDRPRPSRKQGISIMKAIAFVYAKRWNRLRYACINPAIAPWKPAARSAFLEYGSRPGHNPDWAEHRDGRGPRSPQIDATQLDERRRSPARLLITTTSHRLQTRRRQPRHASAIRASAIWVCPFRVDRHRPICALFKPRLGPRSTGL